MTVGSDEETFINRTNTKNDLDHSKVPAVHSTVRLVDGEGIAYSTNFTNTKGKILRDAAKSGGSNAGSENQGKTGKNSCGARESWCSIAKEGHFSAKEGTIPLKKGPDGPKKPATKRASTSIDEEEERPAKKPKTGTNLKERVQHKEIDSLSVYMKPWEGRKFKQGEKSWQRK